MTVPVKGSLTLEASLSSLPKFIGALNEALSQAGCPDKTRREVDTAADEILTNVADYAYPEGGGSVTMAYEICDAVLTLEILDSGIPFNPLKSTSPDISVVSDRGGYGILLVRRLMDKLLYERTSDGKNKLTTVKRIL